MNTTAATSNDFINHSSIPSVRCTHCGQSTTLDTIRFEGRTTCTYCGAPLPMDPPPTQAPDDTEEPEIDATEEVERPATHTFSRAHLLCGGFLLAVFPTALSKLGGNSSQLQQILGSWDPSILLSNSEGSSTAVTGLAGLMAIVKILSLLSGMVMLLFGFIQEE